MPNLDDVLILAPGVISRESDAELVVVLPEKGKYVVLNGTGADVFQLVDGQRTLEEIAAALSERHGVPVERVQADVLTFAQKLLDRDAVRLRSG
jgi:4-diphosphocytidyl-2C-methyl-D-erythritol kinase